MDPVRRDDTERDELLQAVLTGSLDSRHPDVVRRAAEDAEFRDRLEELAGLDITLAAAGNEFRRARDDAAASRPTDLAQTRAALARRPQAAPRRPGRRALWLATAAAVAVAAALVWTTWPGSDATRGEPHLGTDLELTLPEPGLADGMALSWRGPPLSPGGFYRLEVYDSPTALAPAWRSSELAESRFAVSATDLRAWPAEAFVRVVACALDGTIESKSRLLPAPRR
jgi:hypothetical protein